MRVMVAALIIAALVAGCGGSSRPANPKVDEAVALYQKQFNLEAKYTEGMRSAKAIREEGSPVTASRIESSVFHYRNEAAQVWQEILAYGNPVLEKMTAQIKSEKG